MTTDSTQSSGRGRIALLAILTIAVVGVIVFAMIQQNLSRGGGSAAPTSTASPTTTDTASTADEGEGDMEISNGPGVFLDEKKSGQEAIDALGENIEVVAKRNGKTVEELTNLLLGDKSAYISPNGFLLFKDGITKK